MLCFNSNLVDQETPTPPVVDNESAWWDMLHNVVMCLPSMKCVLGFVMIDTME